MMGKDGDKKAFFISPIGDEGSDIRQRSDVVKRLILEAALCPGIVANVERADEHANPGEITPAIIAAILEADLLIVDLTGANPNVYYEMAIAHAYSKPTVHIRLEGEPLPFDIKDVRVFEYGLDLEGGERARQLVRDAADYVLSNPGMVRTPVSGGASLLSAQNSSDPSEQLAGIVLSRLEEMSNDIRALREDAVHEGPRVSSPARSRQVRHRITTLRGEREVLEQLDRELDRQMAELELAGDAQERNDLLAKRKALTERIVTVENELAALGGPWSFPGTV